MFPRASFIAAVSAGGISLAEATAAAFFVGGPAMRTIHGFHLLVILERVEAQPANHAVGERAAFRAGMQRP